MQQQHTKNHSKTTTVESSTDSDTNQSPNRGETENVQNTAQSAAQTQNPSDIDNISDPEQELVDETEAQEDADRSREQNADSERSQSNFRGLDNRKFLLSDIKQHEIDQGHNSSSSTESEQMSRSASLPDLAPSYRSTRYNLRPSPKSPTKLSKSPWKGLFRKHRK